MSSEGKALSLPEVKPQKLNLCQHNAAYADNVSEGKFYTDTFDITTSFNATATTTGQILSHKKSVCFYIQQTDEPLLHGRVFPLAAMFFTLLFPDWTSFAYPIPRGFTMC